jgi:hypothetical protein
MARVARRGQADGQAKSIDFIKHGQDGQGIFYKIKI